MDSLHSTTNLTAIEAVVVNVIMTVNLTNFNTCKVELYSKTGRKLAGNKCSKNWLLRNKTNNSRCNNQPKYL